MPTGATVVPVGTSTQRCVRVIVLYTYLPCTSAIFEKFKCLLQFFSPTSDHPPPAEGISHTISISEQDYDFVEQPSQDFYCPVTYDLLLQPHLTACCGKHLSEKAATMIKEVGGPCAMCKEPNLSTILDKHFRRQLNEHRVFCHNKNRGCGWQGELSDYMKRHIESCPMKNAPLSPM